jgi:spermidine synthase
MTQAPTSGIPASARRTAYLLFLFSGISGLLFETLWTYQATLALGSSYWAVTAVLSAFMAGLALGNFLALRRSVWTLSTYATLEGFILVSGLAALFLLPGLGRHLAPLFGAVAAHPALLNLLRFGISFAVLALPSTAMGMTLPALAQALGGEHGSFRAVLGRLYGLNTFGAVGGVLLGELVLLPKAGVLGTGVVAAVLNGAAALGGWGLSRRWRAGAPSAEPAWDRSIPRSLYPGLVSVFLAGFALLGLEVIWTRLLALFIPNSSLAFALMLATVLSGIALGGLIGSASWVGRRCGFLVLFGAGVALMASYSGFALFHGVGTDFGATEKLLLVGMTLQAPVSFLSGVFFTLAGATFREKISSSQASAGLLVLFNTAGGASGAVVAGLLLVPGLGVEKSLFALSALYGVAAGTWFLVGGGKRQLLAIGAAGWLAGLVFFPFGQFQNRHLPAAAKKWSPVSDFTIEAVREGLTETVVYLQAREFGQPLYHRMVTNSFSMSATMVQADRYMRQFVYWPVALHPAPKRALLICFGVGNTARALVRTRELEHIDVVDISRDILDLSSVVSPDPATHPLRDPRVTVHVEDGRFFLQTRPETWDIITGEPPPPENAGVAGLYSQEYFRLLKERLSPGGIATYWLPIFSLSETASRSILKAWSDTFETCFLWRGSNKDLILVGFRGPAVRVEERRFLAQWEDPATLRELRELGLELPEALGSGFIGDGDYLRALSSNADPSADAFPKRIVAERSGDEQLYTDWFNLGTCASRFAGSPSVSRIWPPGLKERTLAYFKWEELQDYLQKSRFPDFERIHRVCTQSKLRTPLVWVLRSDRDYGRAAAQSEPEIRRQPLPQYHLGVHALADRDYSRAADHLLRTLGAPGMRRIDLTLCLYSLCMAGRTEEAEKIAAALRVEAGKLNVPEGYWAWMKSTFGLQTPLQ